jgi:hypothetical protein
MSNRRDMPSSTSENNENKAQELLLYVKAASGENINQMITSCSIEQILIGHERLHLARIEFLLFAFKYNLLGAHGINIIQNALSLAISFFPLNGFLLHTLLCIEGKLAGGYTRVKAYFGAIDNNRHCWGGGKTCIEKAFEICLEIGRARKNKVMLTGLYSNTKIKDSTSDLIIGKLYHRVDLDSRLKLKILIERSFDDPTMRKCPALWRFYIQMEIYYEHYDDAKRAFLRSIQICWICKDLWLLALGPLRRSFTEKELDAMSVIIEEKGLHLRTES